jgi:hypothetical protein
MGRNFDNRKKLTPIQIMICAGLNSKNIVNSVSSFNDNSSINSNFKGAILG